MPVTRLLYPLYQLGNPQLRIFRPSWFLTLVRPGKEQPQDTVQFRIPMERWARHLLFLTSSLKRSGHQRRALWRRCRRSSWRTKSRGRNSTPGEEGSPSGLDSETDYACVN
uniref:39S ribosomal protein L23, mitochondrial n=1 Tax=Oreochromis niloticus TaxID=8128 RepID=A0A669CFJ1_ORENI